MRTNPVSHNSAFLNAFIISSPLVMCNGILTVISHVLTAGRHLHMLPLLLRKQLCLNFTVTFLFNPVASIFEPLVKNFAVLLMVTIAFSKKDTTAINDSVSIFASREEKGPDTAFYK